MPVVISKTRWDIIKILSKGKKTPSEMAQTLGKSLPTIHRHLEHLESLGMVERTGERRGKTRPYNEYSIGEGFVFFVKALPGDVEKKFLKIDDDMLTHLRIWSIPQREFHHFVESFWWAIENSGHLKDIESVAVFGSVARGDARAGSDIDALILAKNRVREMEEDFGAVMVGYPKGKTIMAQVFTPEDFAQSLKSDSTFAKEVLKNMVIIYDPNKTLEGLRDELERKTS